MQLDDEICLCFHVTKRKVISFLRIEKPRRASQLANCYGAGTGCGWCRPFLERLFEQECGARASASDLPDAQEYAALRAAYIRAGKGTPPPGDPLRPTPESLPVEQRTASGGAAAPPGDPTSQEKTAESLESK
jgi:bacterioferritin-associated ferredoxin